jgi:uncharacterized membrane protein SirB2
MPFLSVHYADIRLFHVSCVILSGGLFLSRGLLRIADAPVANHRALRISSYVIDTALLSGGILLTMVLHQYPFTNAWLTAKLLLLILYIIFGLYALKGSHRRRVRILAFLAALATYAFIVGVAFTHRPAGWITLMRL